MSQQKTSDIGTELSQASWDGLLDLLMQSPDLVAIFDAEDRLQAANPAYADAYHCDPSRRPYWHEIMRENYRNRRGPVMETDDIEAWITDAAARRANIFYRAFEAELHGGRWIWITETLAADGRMLFFASDISRVRTSSRELRLERDAARRASWTDVLTGVPNRRYIMDRLEAWYQTQLPLPVFGEHSLAMIDLDHFKRINDRYGHSVGDSILRSFCETVVQCIRPFDLFGRMGGEEFLFLMPNCPLGVARDRLELLQQTIQHPAQTKSGPSITFTFSAGLVLVRHDRDIHHAIRRADSLLYRAKSEGRARVLC